MIMSLRDLKEEIYLVLQIKGGHGFGFATSPLVVSANLAGNIHESFVTEPCPQPKFESEFVWVMDKTKMKSIWTDKVPVRVECFIVNQSRRSRVGYIILNVKDAQIIQDETKISEKQLRLLGLSKDASLLKPELILLFYITDVPIHSPQLTPHFSPPLESTKVQMADSPLKVSLGSGREHFNLVVDVTSVANLKVLLPTHSDVDPELVSYCYRLFGTNIVSDQSSSHSVRLAITSSLACLKTFFIRHPTITVSLHMGLLHMGETSINLENLMLFEDLHPKKTNHKTRTIICHCAVTPTHSLTEISPEGKSSVDFRVSLSCESLDIKKKVEVSVSCFGAGGDADSNNIAAPLHVPLTLPLATQSLATCLPVENIGDTYCSQSQTAYQMVENGGVTYRAQQPATPHTVSVSVNRLHLDQTEAPHCWLRLSHPCAIVSPEDKVNIPDIWSRVEWQLTVVVPYHLLQSTLSSQPPSLQLGTEDQVIAVAQLLPHDNLTMNKNPSEVVTIALNSSGLKVGEVEVSWTVQCDPDFSTDTTLEDTSLSTPILSHSRTIGAEFLSPRARELKILSFVEELEDWAEKQRIIVMEGLKEEEAARLASLQAQWETEVGGQMSEGRQLIEALHNMRDQLRQKESELQDNQFKLKTYKEELEKVHRSKLQEFKDMSRRMQDEFNHKLSLMASEKVALEREVEEIRKENLKVKQMLREVESQMKGEKRLVDTLTHELNVLKEKLSVEQESKKFFKEHCRKAEQEIQRLHCLRQQELKIRLHSEKKSLEQLAFQQIILERNDLRQDQQLLDDIRQQLVPGNIHADLNLNSSNETTTYTDQHPFMDERHIRRAT